MRRFIVWWVFLFSLLFFITDHSYALVVYPRMAYTYAYSYARLGRRPNYRQDRDYLYWFTNKSLESQSKAVSYGGWGGQEVYASNSVKARWQDASQGHIDIYQACTIRNYNFSMGIGIRSELLYEFAISAPAILSMDYETLFSGMSQAWLGPFNVRIFMPNVNGSWEIIAEQSLDLGQTGNLQILLYNPARYRLFLQTIMDERGIYGRWYGRKIGYFDWRLEKASLPVPEPAAGLLFLIGLPFILHSKSRF